MKKLILSTLFLPVFALAACGDTGTDSADSPESSGTENDDKLQVYTTVYPLTYFTERIGGDLVDVQSVYPAGANEHTFEPTQQDMIAIAEADLMFYIGLGLEGFIDSAKSTLEGEDVEFKALADSITDEQLEAALGHEDEEAHEEDGHEEDAHAEDGHEEDAHAEDGHAEDGHAEDGHAEDAHEEDAHEEDGEHVEEAGHDDHDHGSTDPHLWISPTLSQNLADSIKDSLIAQDPDNEDTYETNHAELISELEELDASFSELHEQVTKDTFFVSHAAFTYLSEPYGFEQVAIAGLNSQDEPSQKELTEIVDLARDKNIEYIVFEQNVSSNLTEVVQKEVGAEAVEMHNLGILTQEDIDNGETYFTLMEKNLEVLETILK
ncbi:metal ABC transporter solute-binding protein, Zn/Mn family [Planococcus salinarum]|uniref:metal ABC transporter solute-binding protein, Zn/Mn family n=1 Tax=Planococcus salinarum TaxID=622695 RepID=UPI000E3D29BF|nr:zinc ABC transporter substrate-binding protein [Planococcus salinarum]TAA69800.1 adhesin [Planococcus salinarum]